MLLRCVLLAVVLPVSAFADIAIITSADYPGELVSGGDWVGASTRFSQTQNGAIAGRYAFKDGTETEQGRLDNCTLSARDIRCVWVDAYGSGTFAARFSSDFESFKGGWFDQVLSGSNLPVEDRSPWNGSR